MGGIFIKKVVIKVLKLCVFMAVGVCSGVER